MHQPSGATRTGPDAPALEDAGRQAVGIWGWLVPTLVLAAVLRFVGIGWGLPDIDVRPDEELTVTMALKFGTGDLNPHWFWYPTLHGYVLFVCDAILTLSWLATGVIHAPSDVLTRYAVDPSAFYLIARALSAASGTATVALVYLLGRRVFGAGVGLAAAFFQAVAFLPVRDSHFGTIDPPMVALTTWAMLPVWSIFERPTRAAYLASGVLVGLAASTKYYGVVACVAIAAAHFLRPRAPGEAPGHGLLVLAALACVGAFVATSPFVVLAFPEFLRDMENVRRVQSGMVDDHVMRAWLVHLVYTFPRGLGWPLFFAGLAGVAGLFGSQPRRALVLFAYPIVFFIVVGASWAAWARYVTPVVPFLALAAGWLVCRGAFAVSRRMGAARGPGLLAAALGLAVGLPSLVEDGYLLHHLIAPDTRRLAGTWVIEHLPDGAEIGWLGSIYGRPPLPQSPESLERRLNVSLEKGRAGVLSRKRLELARSGRPPRYRLLDLPRDPGDWGEGPPEFLMLERYPLFYVRKQVALADDWLRLGGYREVRRWDVAKGTDPLPYSDPQDAVYLPFGQLRRVRRSGPELILYRRGPAATATRSVAARPGDGGGLDP